MTTPTCPACGTPRAGVQRFCPNCGLDYWKHAQEGQQTAQAAVTAPTQAKVVPSGKGKLIAGGVVALLLVGAISTLGRDDNDGASVEATPRETPRRTPRPTPEETIDLSSLSFQIFVSHVASTTPGIADQMGKVGDDALAVDINALMVSSVDLWVQLGEEVEWLEQHPPDACYETTHGLYSEAISTLYEALDQISDGAIYSDVPLIESGTVLLLDGNATMNEATDSIAASEAACG